MFTFAHLYHLSFFKNRMISDFLVWLGGYVPFSFGFHCHLSNKKTTKVAPILSLLEKCNVRAERRDVLVLSPKPIKGFSCKSFFRLLLDLFQLMSWSLMWFEGLRFPKKSSCLSYKFC